MSGEENTKAQGQRMRKLKDAFHVSIKYSLRGLPPEEFAMHFKDGTLSQHHLEGLYEGYMSGLHQSRVFIDREFDILCQENSIDEKLQNLDVMCVEQGILDAQGNSQPSTTAPTKIARRLQLQTKQAEVQQLEAILENIKRQQSEVQIQLEEKKKAARELLEAAAPVQDKLQAVEEAAKAWANRAPEVAAV